MDQSQIQTLRDVEISKKKSGWHLYSIDQSNKKESYPCQYLPQNLQKV